MIRQLRQASLVGLTTFITLAAGRALAMVDVPPALDRVPADAGMVVAIPNISKLQDAMKVVRETFGIQAEQTPMADMEKLFGTAGLNKGGSMAVAVMFPAAEAPDAGKKHAPQDGKKGAGGKGDGRGEDGEGKVVGGEKEEGEPEGDDEKNDMDGGKEDADGDGDKDAENDGDEEADGGEDGEGGQPTAVMVIPVTDYKAFAAGLGGDAGAAVAELQTGGQTMYAKDIGGGFAAMSDNGDALGAFSGKGGSMGAYKALLGKAGSRLTETSDVVVVANLQSLSAKIKEGLAGAQQYLAMAAMGQPNVAVAGGALRALTEALTTDGQAAMLGVDVEADGLRTEVATSFREGSPAASMLRAPGRASGLLGNLPAAQQGYLFAAAMDTTAPGLKKVLESYADEETRAAMAAAEQDNWMSWLSKSEGAAGVVGTSPALMGGPGFFVNTILYGKSGNPSALVEQFRQSATGANGKTQNGVTMSSSYKPGAATVAGASVDEWQLNMKMDPGSPAAGQSQMIFVTLFGPKGGPNGYVAAAKSGAVMTMSKNTPLLEAAIKAAAGEGANFASDPGVKAVSMKLPEGRTLEAYIGVKDVLNMVLPFAAMMGKPIQVDIPADLPPIGIAGTSQDGAMRFTSFVPTEVLKLFTALGKEMQNQDQPENNDAEDAKGSGRPRF